jgi:protein involved in polysaccharide export with SLBB domain
VSRSLVTSIMMLSLLIPSACVAASSSQVAPAPSAAAAVSTDNEYTLAPGDKVRVIVFGEETLTGEYVITSGGNLSFPLVGNMKVTDKTVEQVQVALAAALADGYVNNPRVNIQVISFRPFYILGEVNRPGEYPVSTGLTLQQAVASAGGYTYRANLKRAYLKRANDTEEKLLIVKSSGPVIIRAGDTIRIGERHF